ncbi:kinase-like domain-containing protein [Glomus cerebriforme]|uniref:non-specific serine/threonine protein kinase n=1 Tax=Glomus cerebriforme TaxID=658196 RepID=A0A397SIZ4_9GLOM|nr:kinase-like domain-containing protein [Glomus cerebriforme]
MNNSKNLSLQEAKQLQDDEIEAIKAIYMDDFETVITRNAWKPVAPTGHEFRLHLCPNEEELKKHIKVDLHVKFPKTYPRISPEIKIENARGLSSAQLKQLQIEVTRKVKANVGQEIVYTIAEFVREFITTNNKGIPSVVKQPSFHAQMLSRNEQMSKVQHEKEMEEINKAKQIKEQEDLNLAQKIEEETQRRKEKMEVERQKRKQLKFKVSQELNKCGDHNSMQFTTIDFDSLIMLDPDDSQSIPFKSVMLGPSIGKGPIGITYIVQATNFQIKEVSIPLRHILALKDIEITNPHYLELDGKRKLEEIERDLDVLKKIRHPNTVMIYESELKRRLTGWNLYILMEYARGGTLVDLLKKCGVVRLSLARKYMKQLLTALEHIHNNNFVHKDIKASNILFMEVPGTEESIAKLSDINYHRKLLDMHENYPFTQQSCLEEINRWLPPEQESRPNIYSRKTDIWHMGVIFVQMLFGLKTTQYYNSLDSLFSSSKHEIPDPVKNVLKSMLQMDQRKRPTPLELLNNSFFNEGTSFNEDPVTIIDPSLKYMISPGQPNLSRDIHTLFNKENHNEIVGGFSSHHAVSPPTLSTQNVSFSRYKLDFEELAFLGRGGFGEVVKARNKLDGRYYAIKKVRLNPNDIEKTKKILREVTTLSRLHHQYVVRYYTTWFEDSDNSWNDTESFSEDITTDEESISSNTNDVDFPDSDDFDLMLEASSNRGYSHIRFGESSSSDSDDEFDLQNEDSPKDAGLYSVRNRTPGPGKKNNSKEEKTRILYIQMEYCENKTLRDIIDLGMNEDEGWKIFRQIVEGLAHIHRQIHRDLKPSNIFLDANGDVKIGDFGLATTNNAMFDPGSFRNVQMGNEDSMTGGIGTTLYVAPEVTSNVVIGTRYNQKVDIYSLGIIFFEICYKFSTEMERRMTIMNLRKPEIIFPAEFMISKNQNKIKLIRWCLHHNAKDRPTSLEILKSELLPAKIEDEHMQDVVRAMAKPNTPYYRALMSNLFTQSPDKSKDYTYDLNSGNNFDQLNALTYIRVRDHMMKIFRHHGAVELNTPLLMPKCNLYEEDKKAVYLIDGDGGLVQLPYDLTVPFTRYISRNNIMNLKRYTFDCVYRESIVGGQPRTMYEVDFDIVHSSPAPMVAEAEIIKIVDEILLEFPPIKSLNYVFYVNHANILKIIFDSCRIPEDISRGVCGLLGQLDKKYTLSQIKTQLMNKYELSKMILDELILFDIRGNLEFVSSSLEKLIPSTSMKSQIREVFKDFKLLLDYVKSLGVNHEIIFVPLLVYNDHYYKNGIIFQVVNDNNHKDVLAAGGRYDWLIQQFRHPTAVCGKGRARQQIYGIGVSIAMQKIIFALENYQTAILKSKKVEEEKNFNFWAPRRCDVYVASFGKTLLQERLDLVGELWAHNIKADFMYEEPTDLTPEILTTKCKNQGINWIVIMKYKTQDTTSVSRDALITVKIKNLIKKTEEEVLRSEVIMKLSSEIMRAELASGASGSKYHKHFSVTQTDYLSAHDYGNTSLSTSPESSSRLSISVVVPPTQKNNKKMKHKQKKLLMDKAHDNISSIVEQIKNNGVPVLAVDLSKDLLRKMSDCNVLEDESFKNKILDIAPLHQKEYVLEVQNILKNRRNQEGHKHVWLHSHRDDFGILYQFFS